MYSLITSSARHWQIEESPVESHQDGWGTATHDVPGEAEEHGFVQFGKRKVGGYPKSSTV